MIFTIMTCRKHASQTETTGVERIKRVRSYRRVHWSALKCVYCGIIRADQRSQFRDCQHIRQSDIRL